MWDLTPSLPLLLWSRLVREAHHHETYDIEVLARTLSGQSWAMLIRQSRLLQLGEDNLQASIMCCLQLNNSVLRTVAAGASIVLRICVSHKIFDMRNRNIRQVNSKDDRRITQHNIQARKPQFTLCKKILLPAR